MTKMAASLPLALMFPGIFSKYKIATLTPILWIALLFANHLFAYLNHQLLFWLLVVAFIMNSFVSCLCAAGRAPEYSDKAIYKLTNVLSWTVLYISIAFSRPYLIAADFYKVQGQSMLPIYESGELVFVDLKSNDYDIGSVVIAKPKQFPIIIVKRIVDVNQQGDMRQFFLLSDNFEEIYDSRIFGWVNEADMAGLVHWKL